MRLVYCDRCGRQGSERRADPSGVRIVRLTWEPHQRTMDLCGDCRKALTPALDAFLDAKADDTERLRDAIRDMLDVSTGWTRNYFHLEALWTITELGTAALTTADPSGSAPDSASNASPQSPA